jgi:hypothetical protein
MSVAWDRLPDTAAHNFRSPATECTVLAKYMTKQDLANAEFCPPERGVLEEPYPQIDSVSVPVLPGESEPRRLSAAS